MKLIGWVDFSSEDREKVRSVMSLLQVKGAVDELGIGVIRDAFANKFFPGTSTIQTRAKYFLIVPYLLQEAIEGKYGDQINLIMDRVNEQERKCAQILVGKSGEVGIIGSLSIARGKWVSRPPSEIYWSGIRTWNIFKQGDLSIPSMLQYSIDIRREEKSNKKNLGNRKEDAEEGAKDDIDAGRLQKVRFFDLPDHAIDWKEQLDIALDPNEAEFLEYKILESVPDSLLGFIIKHETNIQECDSFEALYELLKDEVSDDMSHLMKIACDFNRLVCAARVRYNVLLYRNQDENTNRMWDYIENDIVRHTEVDLRDVFKTLGIVKSDLKSFLLKLQNAMNHRDWNAVDELIRKREIDLKTKGRAKLLHPEDYELVNRDNIELDYRFFSAKRIIEDIYAGEGKYDV